MVSTNRAQHIAILTGPTASGKTGLAIQIAKQALAQGVVIQLINADSLQMIREFDVGTAKPSPSELNEAPHQLIDVINADSPCTAGDFVRLVRDCIFNNERNGHRSLIVGGTGFYIKALLTELWPGGPSETEGQSATPYDPELFQKLVTADPDTAYKIGQNDHYRIKRALQIMQATGKKISELSFTPAADADRYKIITVDRQTQELDQRIVLRTQVMVDQGLIEETTRLLKKYPKARALDSVGYKQAVQFLRDQKPQGRKVKPGVQGLIDEINLATRQLVKSQRTWMRGQYKGLHVDSYTLQAQETPCVDSLKKIYGLV